MKIKLIYVLFAASLISCTEELKPIEDKSGSKDSFFESEHNHEEGSGRTEVSIVEILSGERYSYLKVNDGKREYWISTLKEDYQEGDQYYYTESIFKTDFYSTEFNRNFKEFYLVSDMQPLTVESNANSNSTGAASPDLSVKRSEVERAGSTKIVELIDQASKFVGKEVQVTGKVVKVNANIMDRHWIHIKDATKDDYDFVLTSKDMVPVGHIVTFKGKYNKNVDFGSGYRFDYILENAKIVK